MDGYYVASLAAEDDGPYTLQELSAKAQAGHIVPTTQIKCPSGVVVPASMVSGIEGLSKAAIQQIPAYHGSLPYSDSSSKKQIGGFNIGAFALTWIWGLFHRTPMSLLALGLDIIVAAVVTLATMRILPLDALTIISVVHWPLMVWFGIEGNKWAWQSGRYQTVEQMKAAQKKWAWAGGICAGLIALAALVSILLAAYYFQSTMHMIDEISNPSFGGE